MKSPNHSNNIVHGLWINGQLSAMENLCIASFLDKGYLFQLWTYDASTKAIVDGVEYKDANEIIPSDRAFQYQNTNQYGHGKGSWAGFSDIFRYELLYQKGGWWTDMDITCLDRLPESSGHIFREMKKGKAAVGNLMFAPVNSKVMRFCSEQAQKYIHKDNTNWNLPIQILNESIEKHSLKDQIQSYTNPDSWLLVSEYLRVNKSTYKWKAFHWMNEEFRRLQISKDACFPNSFYEQQLLQYNIPHLQLDSVLQKEYLHKTSKWNYLKTSLPHLLSWFR